MQACWVYVHLLARGMVRGDGRDRGISSKGTSYARRSLLFTTYAALC
jgi:hypothetical protein